jgi:5S rRNA maturation endonuclease (ribonuclease M5)
MIDKDQVKRAATLATYGHYLPDLKTRNGAKTATCPFHQDAHPSLCVYKKDGVWLWACHPCKTGGDIIKLVMELRKIDFRQALSELAELLGITDDSPGSSSPWTYDQKQAHDDLLCDDPAMTYLAGRGISRATVQASQLGVCDFPNLGRSIGIPYDEGVVKFRALKPSDQKGAKFRHLAGGSSAHLLFGIDSVEFDLMFDSEGAVHLTESELDALTMRSAGLIAVSVTSATSCLNSDQTLKIPDETIRRLDQAERIFLWFDQDEAGQKCASAFEKKLPQYKTFRVTWTWAGKGSDDPKDVGELYTQEPASFLERILKLKDKAQNRLPAWRALFKSPSEMDSGDLQFLIDGFLPEGVTFLGALSGSGKTWFSLSMAKALVSGQKFLGHFGVPAPVNVVYLVPESGERAFHNRLEKMGISGSNFLCRTMRDGLLSLSDPQLLLAMEKLRPVVFLDTAIRFSAGDENSASENAKGLAGDVFALLNRGARAVVGLHHSAKSTGTAAHLTLENVLRGSGDLGAMCDAVYALTVEDREMVEIRVENVKARDFEPIRPFHITGRPHINEDGDFKMTAPPDKPREHAESDKLSEAIAVNPTASYRTLADVTGISKNRIPKVAAKIGWTKARDSDNWTRTGQLILASAAA